MKKCNGCKKRIFSWQQQCSAGLEEDITMHDYHKKCFKRNHYKEWKFFFPEKIIRVFNGDKIPKTGYYAIVEHDKKCDKIMYTERLILMVKGDEAPKPLICQHDVQWECMKEYE